MANEPVTLKKDSIGDIVRKAESDFTSGITQVSKYDDFSLWEDMNRVFAYLGSKHISGETDDQGREKPFFNIVLAARNIWFRATDIDRSHIKIRPTKSSQDIGALLATIHLQNWMRRENFGQFLNNWGLNSAGFNESIVKFVEQGDKLHALVIPWNKIICDSTDFENNPKIELLEFTEAQLRKKKEYDQDMVEQLCTALTTRKDTAGTDKDSKSDYIKLYEIHGELPLSYITEDPKDDYEYVQQMHVVSFVAKNDKKGEFDDFTLFSGKEAKDPYMLTALLPEVDGSIALRGAVKVLFDAQWMENHNAKLIKDQLDHASIVVHQTADTNLQGRNTLTDMLNGEIIVHAVNAPLTKVDNAPIDIAQLQSSGASWKQLGNEVAGISEAMLGAAPKSGTAWRQTQATLIENHDLFELMTENRGLAVEKMLREFVIPFLKKKMNNKDEIAATLQSVDITKIDSRYIKNYSTKKTSGAVIDKLLKGENITAEDQAQMMTDNTNEAKSALSDQGNTRFFAPSEVPDKTWDELFKDLEWEVEVDVTNESLDKDALTTLNNLLAIIADPVKSQVLGTPQGKLIFNKVLELTGAVSTVELADIPAPQPQVPPGNPALVGAEQPQQK